MEVFAWHYQEAALFLSHVDNAFGGSLPDVFVIFSGFYPGVILFFH
jgi:hypothetical protein